MMKTTWTGFPEETEVEVRRRALKRAKVDNVQEVNEDILILERRMLDNQEERARLRREYMQMDSKRTKLMAQLGRRARRLWGPDKKDGVVIPKTE